MKGFFCFEPGEPTLSGRIFGGREPVFATPFIFLSRGTRIFQQNSAPEPRISYIKAVQQNGRAWRIASDADR
jgi:hypothetical protein